MESDTDISPASIDEVDNVLVADTEKDNVLENNLVSKKKQPLKVDGDGDWKTIKAAKLVVEEGNWSCKYQWCIEGDDSDMLSCRKCKSKYHRCTELPPYQISMFKSTGYRKYV